MKRKIFVVDDELSMRELLKDFLTSQGYDVECFSTADAALLALKKNGEVSAVVADVRMSPLTGLVLAQVVKREHPKITVLLFTGQGNVEEKQRASHFSDAYLCKPFSLAELKSLLERSLKTRARKH